MFPDETFFTNFIFLETLTRKPLMETGASTPQRDQPRDQYKPQQERTPQKDNKPSYQGANHTGPYSQPSYVPEDPALTR